MVVQWSNKFLSATAIMKWCSPLYMPYIQLLCLLYFQLVIYSVAYIKNLCGWNVLLMVHVLFSHVHNLICTFQKSTAILLGITPSLMLWNSLPLSMRTSSSLIIFKMLKHFFLNMPFIIVNIVDIKCF